ncbi:hypothetical protein V8B97DRAFT_962144 [Scleroderma yunnanense]
MSSARQWFTKRVRPAPKAPKDPPCPVAEKYSLHADAGKSPHPFKFNTLAAAMTRKSKKSHPPLPIQDLPTLPAPMPHNTPKYSKRPPSKSVSSAVHSGDDPIEPQTPSDGPRDRLSFPLSIMTLSDPDPFSAMAFTVPKDTADGLLSSPTGIAPKENTVILPFARSSVASVSSHSHLPSAPLSPVSPKSPSPSDRGKTFLKTLPEHLDHDPSPPEEDSPCTQRPSLARRTSTATLTDKNTAETMPYLRPRGYTESTSRSTPSLPHVQRMTLTPPMCEPTSVAALPRSSIIHRKISALRVATNPPCAPPPHALPAVPIPCKSGDDDINDNSHPSPSGSGSSSSISFASSASPTLDYTDEYLDPRYRMLRERPMTADRESVTSGMPVYKDISHSPLTESVNGSSTANYPPSSSGHSLKKSVSHSTLQKCMPTWLPPSPSSSDANAADKEPKKQRSFHQSRHQPSSAHPSLRHINSCTPSPSTFAPESPDSRRGVPSSPPVTVRKRLFSGSSQRRPSTTTTEEDLRSVFSLPSEMERNQSSVPIHTASLNDDQGSDSAPHGAPTTSPTEYAQQILSPAEMFAVEAKVQSEFESKYGEVIRNRHQMPASVLVSPFEPPLSFAKEGLNSAPSAFPRFAICTSSNGSQDLPVPQLTVRPSTAQELPHPSSSLLSLQSRPSTGLPLPPPRIRSRPHTAEPSYNKESGIPCVTSNRMSSVPFIPLSPPPRRTPANVVTREEPQKLMMRKPSFLDINDETEDSFLDLGGGKRSLDFSPEEDEDEDRVFVY